MHWPYVSRRAYDLLVDERDRLRARNDELTDHLVRLARTTNGLRGLEGGQANTDPMPRGGGLVSPLPCTYKKAARALGFSPATVRTPFVHMAARLPYHHLAAKAAV